MKTVNVPFRFLIHSNNFQAFPFSKEIFKVLYGGVHEKRIKIIMRVKWEIHNIN